MASSLIFSMTLWQVQGWEFIAKTATYKLRHRICNSWPKNFIVPDCKKNYFWPQHVIGPGCKKTFLSQGWEAISSHNILGQAAKKHFHSQSGMQFPATTFYWARLQKTFLSSGQVLQLVFFLSLIFSSYLLIMDLLSHDCAWLHSCMY